MADVINLPPLPGLPDVALAPSVPAPVPLTADDPGVLAALGDPAWGVYSQGVPVIVADTVTEVGYSKTSSISNYPIEDGGFSAYDKQATPYEARVRLASGGSSDRRQALLSSVEAIEDDLGLYDVVSPDRVYSNSNLTRFEYNRTAQEGGASLLAVEVSVQEVRILNAPIPNNAAEPASANQVDGGVVQPLDPTPAQSSAALPFFASGTPLPATLGGGFAP